MAARRPESLRGAVLVMALLVACPASLRAQGGSPGASAPPVVQENECTPEWVPAFGPWPGISFKGSSFLAVQALTVFDDGRSDGPGLYVGGLFDTAGSIKTRNIARWNGKHFTPLASGIDGLYGSVDAMAVFDDGDGPALYVGGRFRSIGGERYLRLAKWDGSQWSRVGDGVGTPYSSTDRVRALGVYDDGSGAGPALYVGGLFGNVGSLAANNIARWDGSAWATLGAGTNLEVRSFAVFDDGTGHGTTLFVGGRFTTAGGGIAPHVARWNGSSWSALSSGFTGGGGFTFFDIFVAALAVADLEDGNGPALFAAGSFSKAGGVPAKGIARWDGTSWNPLGGGLESTVLDLVAGGDEHGPLLIAAGEFEHADSVPFTRGIAAWNGNEWIALGAGLDHDVQAVAYHDAGTGLGRSLHAGGRFSTSGGNLVRGMATWDGTVWSPISMGFDGPVSVLAELDAGSGAAVYAGGSFRQVGGKLVNRIARRDGQEWEPLRSGFNNEVLALAAHSALGGGPALYAGGSFLWAGSQPVSRISRWDGTSWSPLGSGVNGTVRALAVYEEPGLGPVLYVGGSFWSAGGLTSPDLARWDGTAWSSTAKLNAGSVRAMKVFDDGSGDGPCLYVGGLFSQFGDLQANGIVRWNGVDWSALGSGLELGVLHDTGVHALEVFDGGSGPALIVGGEFTVAGGRPASRIARWQGGEWHPLNEGLRTTVTALASRAESSGMVLYAGGVPLAGIFLATQPPLGLRKWDGSAWSDVERSPQHIATLLVHDSGDGQGPLLWCGGPELKPGAGADSYVNLNRTCPAAPPRWTDLGHALAGAAGLPQLSGSGSLVPGSPGRLRLTQAAPHAAATLAVSLGSTRTPFRSGHLLAVPPAFLIPVSTTNDGEAILPWPSWPAGISSQELCFQFVIADEAAPQGLALSNAVSARAP